MFDIAIKSKANTPFQNFAKDRKQRNRSIILSYFFTFLFMNRSDICGFPLRWNMTGMEWLNSSQMLGAISRLHACGSGDGTPSGPDVFEVSRLVKHWKTLASLIYINNTFSKITQP